jgi:hypothetical protein
MINNLKKANEKNKERTPRTLEQFKRTIINHFKKANNDHDKEGETKTSTRRKTLITLKKAYENIKEEKEKEGRQMARETEFLSLTEKDVYQSVKRPKNRRVIGSKWVDTKPHKMVNGEYKQIYKSRLVAKGFSQLFGIDYHDIYAPTATYTAIRTLITGAIQRNLKMRHIDIKTAYLNAKLKEEIYLEIPKDLKDRFPEDTVWRLKKALYGLKQSGRAWNDEFNETLIKAGYKRLFSDKCVYTKREKNGNLAILAIYVDDIIFLYDEDQSLESLLNSLTERGYGVKDLGELKQTLGLEVKHMNGESFLSQTEYTRKILQNYGYMDCNPTKTPAHHIIPTEEELNAWNKPELCKHKREEIVGTLLWLSRLTRPDISFAVSRLAQYINEKTELFYFMGARILRYLRGTLDYGIRLSPPPNTRRLATDSPHSVELVAFADADFAGDKRTRKSQSGYIFFLNGSPISWNSKKQSIVALSSTEAEIYALSGAIQEASFFRTLFRELDQPIEQPTEIYEDNNQAKLRAETNINSKFLKHIDIKYHHINDSVHNKQTKISRVSSAKNIADIFTKALSPHKFRELARQFMCRIVPST